MLLPLQHKPLGISCHMGHLATDLQELGEKVQENANILDTTIVVMKLLF
jgi:hypothetical protein